MEKLSRYAKVRLAQAEESRLRYARLLSKLVHGVSQPLTVMEGLLESGLLSNQTKAQYSSVLEASLQEADRLSQLVRRIREVAEMECAPEALQAVPLVRTLSRTVEKIAPWAESKRLNIQIDAPREILVRSDPRRLEWAVQKLITGSLQRSPECGNVRISISRSKVGAILTLSDQGPNVPSQILEDLLDPLSRTFTTPRDSEADGLEWALAQWMFQSSGASLAVRNEAKRRCAVTVTLPLWVRENR